MVGNDGGVYVTDNYGVWKLDQDTGETIWFSRFSDYSGNKLASNDLRLLNEGPNGLVGNVFSSGWHIWLDTADGSPIIVKEPDPFEATDCDPRSQFFISISGGELDKSGELEEAAARLGYAAWNLDKAFQTQLAEAEARAELDAASAGQMSGDAAEAANDCRAARALLLSRQPDIPTQGEVKDATKFAERCLDRLNELMSSI